MAHNILVHDCQPQVVSNILDIDVERLVPLGGLASTLMRLGASLEIATMDLHPGVHLGPEVGVAGQLCLLDGERKFS